MLTRLLNKLRERALRTGVCTAARQPGRRVAVPRCKAVNGRVQRSCATGMPSMDRRREAQAPDNTPDYRNCHHVPTSTIRVPLNSRGGSIIIWSHLHQHWARPDHICARTSWTHHHHICARAWAHPCHICARAWAHPCHICAGTGLTTGTSDRAHPLRRRAARGGRHTGHCALQCSAERPMVGGTRRWLAPGRTRQASQPKSTLVFQKPSLPHTRHSLRPPLLAPSDLDVPAKPVRRRGTP